MHKGSYLDSATLIVAPTSDGDGEYVSIDAVVPDGRRLVWCGSTMEALDLARSITGAAVQTGARHAKEGAAT
jgi:hypothetical protein